MYQQKKKLFGGVCIVRIDKIFILSSFLLLTAYSSHSNDYQDLQKAISTQNSSEYKAYDSKMSYCRGLRDREVNQVNDSYFNSLTDAQKSKVLGILLFKASDRCYAYEEAQYFKFVIRTNDADGMKILKLASFAPQQTEASKAIIDSLDSKEVERLSNTEQFSTPFDIIHLLDKLGL
uniref:Uncharacterized protein n=1 Tax=Aliivibrio wodanis TaxID=80852 RepID=A0A5Q4ZVM8_9GAMM|nr:hypothetical protein AW0309160_03521 [Aliivibrio wodanis]